MISDINHNHDKLFRDSPFYRQVAKGVPSENVEMDCGCSAWKDLQANVTRNHRCLTMSELMIEIREYLATLDPNVNVTEFRVAA